MQFSLSSTMAVQSILRQRCTCIAITAIALAAPSLLDAQTTKALPLRDLTPPEAVTPDPFGRIVNVRELRDGSVLVNDGARRQVVALDAGLRTRGIVLDTFTTRVGYGRSPGALALLKADSLVFISRSGISVIDPSGRVVDWMPSTQQPLISAITGVNNGIDRYGYVIFTPSVSNRQPTSGASSPNATANTGSPPAPSAGPPENISFVVRADFKTRKITKLATLKREAGARVGMETAPDGRKFARTIVNPLSTWDDYAILSDGTVAVVRTDDYHIEFIRPDGNIDTTAALPFEWKRLSNADRKAIIDSTRTAQLQAEAAGIMTPERQGASVMAAVAVANKSGINSGKIGDGFTVDVVRADSIAAGVVKGYSGSAAPPPPVNALPFGMTAADLEYVPFTELPTRYPPFRLEALNVDLNDNIWIRTTAKDPSGNAGAIYDVVNTRGALVERVRVPAGKFIAGFGRDGAVYLKYEVAKNWAVERTRISRQ